MIVDCHTRVWTSPAQLGAAFADVGSLCADELHHREALGPVDRAIVLGFKSRYLGAEIPNRLVAECVRRNAAKLVGFAGIDPTDPAWPEDLRVAQDELNLKGVILSPALQDFHPCDTRAQRLYEACERRGLPIVFEPSHRQAAARLEYAAPALLDEVARSFPALRIVIARLGHPWISETVVLLGKHPHVYASVAGLLRQPWESYTALLSASEYGVMDKILFGSDFPFRAPAACIEALYSVNQFGHGSVLPVIPREQLRGIVERDTLQLLGIRTSDAPPARPSSKIFSDED